MAQRDAKYARSMLKRNSASFSDKNEQQPKLDISDRERYYFKRMSIMN